MAALSNICLLLAALFAILGYVTSGERVYETVDGDIVSVRTVLFILAAVSLFAWLALEFNNYS